jgi:hypothetical protein
MATHLSTCKIAVHGSGAGQRCSRHGMRTYQPLYRVKHLTLLPASSPDSRPALAASKPPMDTPRMICRAPRMLLSCQGSLRCRCACESIEMRDPVLGGAHLVGVLQVVVAVQYVEGRLADVAAQIQHHVSKARAERLCMIWQQHSRVLCVQVACVHADGKSSQQLADPPAPGMSPMRCSVGLFRISPALPISSCEKTRMTACRVPPQC